MIYLKFAFCKWQRYVMLAFEHKKYVPTQGALYKWTEHSPNFYFRNYKVGVLPITPQGWIGVDGMNLDHNITQKIHVKIFLMRGQKKV